MSVVTVGLLQPNVTVRENETFSVCVELTAGSLERDVFVGLLVSNSSAVRKFGFRSRSLCQCLLINYCVLA